MFYKMIQQKRDSWYASSECKVRNLIDYIEKSDKMRDAQVEAIKTYLFLKIAGNNQPLSNLFIDGFFNTLNLDNIELRNDIRIYLSSNPAAAALYEYASLTDDSGEEVSPKIVDKIKNSPENIDYIKVFNDLFYGISYTDYLFSLPMGAGKTYLMAAFIYLDLYFATNEPDNVSFAHNFIILVPSGLKSSVVPSLRTIQNFDPAWIIPQPAAGALKRKLIFEVLDQNKSGNKSTKTRNPNVEKIASHQPLVDLFGFVAVINAEKVILDRIKETNGQVNLFEDSDDEKDRQANELRNMIGRLPQLSIFIDEVHHAAKDDKKLRAVVNKWVKNDTVTGVIGFTGTPYLNKIERVRVAEKLIIANSEISNIVNYYPLLKGIGNFLKTPIVKISTNRNRLTIVEGGVRAFLNKYRDKIYVDGTCAKLGIYCGSIDVLEEQIYPLVQKIVEEYKLDYNEVILKFHGGNKKYPIPVDSSLQFSTLDNPISKIKIILLVQIGKEGWDCKSLTGIVLSQQGDCPPNMVLQTSCRCLRQVQKGQKESALIYLNEDNANILNKQLEEQHHITIKEFERGDNSVFTEINRYDRTKYLKLPKVDFYQLMVSYQTLLINESTEVTSQIMKATEGAEVSTLIKEARFSSNLKVIEYNYEMDETTNPITTFNAWLYEISKQSFGHIKFQDLSKYTKELSSIFESITYKKGDFYYFSSKYNLEIVNANIRKAFYERRTFETIEELIPEDASLLKLDNFQTKIKTKTPQDFYPSVEMVRNIIRDDEGKLNVDPKAEQLIQFLRENNNEDMAISLENKVISHPMKNQSFHYIPYKTDSNFEQVFLEEILKLSIIKEKGLEVYYNGDKALTEFKIKCYKRKGKAFQYIGMYTPDFLIISRKGERIYKALIIETKGKIYANDPMFKDKKEFVEKVFKDKNNLKFQYDRFEYLYLEDSLTTNERLGQVDDIIKKFFKEG